MNCPYCGNPVNNKAKFCGNCGHKLYYCAGCGNLLERRGKFCSVDGTKVPPEVYDDLPMEPSAPSPSQSTSLEPEGLAPSQSTSLEPEGQTPVAPLKRKPQPEEKKSLRREKPEKPEKARKKPAKSKASDDEKPHNPFLAMQVLITVFLIVVCIGLGVLLFMDWDQNGVLPWERSANKKQSETQVQDPSETESEETEKADSDTAEAGPASQEAEVQGPSADGGSQSADQQAVNQQTADQQAATQQSPAQASSDHPAEAEANQIPAEPAPKVSMDNVSYIESSSRLAPTDKYTYGGNNVVDGKLETAWTEGVDGEGIGEYITLNLDGEYQVSGIAINAGYQKSKDVYTKNARPKEIMIEFSNGKTARSTLEDAYGKQSLTLAAPVTTSWVKITINSVYSGSDYADTCISEVSLY